MITIRQKPTVLTQAKTEKGWKFVVSVDGEEFSVELEKDYWQKLTCGKEEPEELVRRSFGFLLARESKESILREFDLSLIQKYFPEFEEEIKPTDLR